jgi:transcriptional regulator with XRE-family HTH domain
MNLSRTALAKRAGVPTSTVSRIEVGQMEPTVAMLQRLTEAAGRRTRVDTTVPELPSLSALARHLQLTRTGEELDWTAVRRLLDELDQRPELVPGAIATAAQQRASTGPTSRQVCETPPTGSTRTAERRRPPSGSGGAGGSHSAVTVY